MTLTETDRELLERLVARAEKRLEAELQLAITAMAATLRVEFRSELEQLASRVDGVHKEALRALTHRVNGGTST